MLYLLQNFRRYILILNTKSICSVENGYFCLSSCSNAHITGMQPHVRAGALTFIKHMESDAVLSSILVSLPTFQSSVLAASSGFGSKAKWSNTKLESLCLLLSASLHGLFLNSEDGSSTVLRNVSKLLSDYMAPQPTSSCSSCLQPYKPEIAQPYILAYTRRFLPHVLRQAGRQAGRSSICMLWLCEMLKVKPYAVHKAPSFHPPSGCVTDTVGAHQHITPGYVLPTIVSTAGNFSDTCAGGKSKQNVAGGLQTEPKMYSSIGIENRL
jgi:hypothetical protein